MNSVIIVIISFLLFAFGYDWGRWINIVYTFSILFYFYLIRNSHISNDLNINKNMLSLFNRRKFITVIAFILFAFSWNPKSVITGDIASFPVYRIPYKFLKIINN